MIFIGMGANIGGPVENLNRALNLMDEHGIRVRRHSAFYHTPAWGIIEQNDFVNAVAEVIYPNRPSKLLAQLQEIELQMGRVRKQKWGPRLIDLDILEFNRTVLKKPGLILPHPGYTHRLFNLIPLAELEPDWRPTGYRENIQQLIQKLPPEDIKPLEKQDTGRII